MYQMYTGHMTSDSSKLKLKNRLEEQVAHLEDYNNHDDPEYPGWTFLLGDVVKTYGICPFLNVHDSDCRIRRIEWLQQQKDNGAIYFDAVGKLSDQQWLADLETEMENIREEVRLYVLDVIESLNLGNKGNDCDKGDKGGKGGKECNIDHDTLINSIRTRKEAKKSKQKSERSLESNSTNT